jgi:hypothetical protein
MTVQEMQASVNNAAMDRYIVQLQKEAREAVDDGAGWTRTVTGGHDQDRNEKMAKFEMNKKNQQLLRDQIEMNKVRRAEDRREFIESASTHSFPLFCETFISATEVEEYRQAQKMKFRAALDEQTTIQKTMKNLEEKKYNDQALANNRQNVLSMGRDRGREAQRLRNQGQTFVKSWDRDKKLSAIREAIRSGKDMTHTLTKA